MEELRYPNARFVESAVTAYFDRLGYKSNFGLDGSGNLIQFDHKKTGTHWVVGFLGSTRDSDACLALALGDLIQGMTNTDWIYGLALPDVQRERKLILSIRKWVRVNLGLHWLVVSSTGSVKEVLPDRGV